MLHKSVQKYNTRITKYMNIRNKGTVFCAQMLWLLDGINTQITEKYLFGKALFKLKPMQMNLEFRKLKQNQILPFFLRNECMQKP